MKSNLEWLFITIFLLAASSADPVRNRRDLAKIQNIIKWILGINERKFIQTVPLRRVYTIPAYEKFLRALSPMEINGNIKHVFKEGLYPRIPYMPIQPIQNHYPFTYSNYHPEMQEYTRIRDRDYGYGRPVYPINRVSTYQNSVAPLCPTSVTNLGACGYDDATILTEMSLPLPQPPMYIQNRMRQVILDNPIPPVNLQQDIVIPPSGLRKVTYMNMINEATPTKDSIEKEMQLIPVPNLHQDIVIPPSKLRQVTYMNMINEATSTKHPIEKEVQLIPVPGLTLKPEAYHDTQSLITNSAVGVKKTVTFTAPVHSKYKYKMIYHNQPQKNTVVEMDSMKTDTPKEEETLTPSITKSTDQMNSPSTISVVKNKVPDDYVFMPPINTEILQSSLPMVNNIKSSKSDDLSAVASENRPIVLLDEPVNDSKADKSTKVIIRRRKLKSRPENGRGDIPETYLQ